MYHNKSESPNLDHFHVGRLGYLIPVGPHGGKMLFQGFPNELLGFLQCEPKSHTSRQVGHVCSPPVAGFLEYRRRIPSSLQPCRAGTSTASATVVGSGTGYPNWRMQSKWPSIASFMRSRVSSSVALRQHSREDPGRARCNQWWSVHIIRRTSLLEPCLFQNR